MTAIGDETATIGSGRSVSGLYALVRTISALVLRDLALRGRQSKLGHASSLIEPLLQFGVIYGLRVVIEAEPDFGMSLVEFLLSGFVPFFLFMHTSTKVLGAVKGSGPMRRLPMVSTLDFALARCILEMLTMVVIGIIAFFIINFFGVDAIPVDPVGIVEAVGAITLLALGFGLVNGVLAKLYALWGVLYGLSARLLIFASGIFFIHDLMPEPKRTFVSYNPLLHGVEWFRSAVYHGYPVGALDTTYLLSWGFCTVVLGLALERVMRRKVWE